ncbi:hypothetical protein OHB11_09265 [Streptomyces zaomyceticus]|uniref:hypothetical protein n=1 Tax=Streptomyces zaomyceticus TaxID=68286 RepID=UPI003252155A
MSSSSYRYRGLFISRKPDGSLHLRRKGTVISAWAAMAVLDPVLLLAGLAAVEEQGFTGSGLLIFLGIFNSACVRSGLRPRVVLEPDGNVQDVTPLSVARVRIAKSGDIEVSRNGLAVLQGGRPHYVWSFSASAIGARSAQSARKAILDWLPTEREGAGLMSRWETRRRIFVTWSDVAVMATPVALGLLVSR